MNTEIFDFNKEAKYTATYFIKYIKQIHDIDLNAIDISEFIKFYQKKRTFHTTQDTFIHICQFLTIGDIIKFSTLCREFIEYYPFVWDIIHKQWFPASIAQNLSYKEIRTAISLEYYYHELVEHNMKDEDWIRINNAEKNMEKYAELMKVAIENPQGDVQATEYFHNYKAHEDERVRAIAHVSYEMIKFLNRYKFNSLINMCKIQYVTIKPEINCEVYGMDHEKDKKMVRNKRGWMTGEYTSKVEYDYKSDDENIDEFVYAIDPVFNRRFRYRIRPDYC